MEPTRSQETTLEVSTIHPGKLIDEIAGLRPYIQYTCYPSIVRPGEIRLHRTLLMHALEFPDKRIQNNHQRGTPGIVIPGSDLPGLLNSMQSAAFLDAKQIIEVITRFTPAPTLSKPLLKKGRSPTTQNHHIMTHAGSKSTDSQADEFEGHWIGIPDRPLDPGSSSKNRNRC